MKVLWLCNILPPAIAAEMKKDTSVKEGWISGTLGKLIDENRSCSEEERIELAIAYPVGDPADENMTIVSLQGMAIACYSFYEDSRQPHNYSLSMDRRFRSILADYKPDVVHAYGTEYPHTLAMARELKDTNKLLISLQGIISKIGDEYTADLTEDVVNARTFRDIIRKDNIAQQQAKFYERGEFEKEAIALTRHVAGRTDFDRRASLEYNPDVTYHYLGESLRDTFYQGTWDLASCDKHTIFVSQADYTIKGFHFLLEALPEIIERYPDTRVKVGGNTIVNVEGIKNRIKLSSYGRFLRALMESYNLLNRIEFLGPMNAEEMKLQYIRCHTFVCPSVIENSPNSVGEAMLLGVPVVASRVGGIPSILHEPEEGLLFERGNSSGLADAVIRIWENDGIALEMSAAEISRANNNYNRDDNHRMLLKIYKRISNLKSVE